VKVPPDVGGADSVPFREFIGASSPEEFNHACRRAGFAMDEPVTFVRPDPTTFVLLIARTGPGTGNVSLPGAALRNGAQNFKPAGTDYATDRDLRDAGYVAAAPIREAIDRFRSQEPRNRPEVGDFLVELLLHVKAGGPPNGSG